MNHDLDTSAVEGQRRPGSACEPKSESYDDPEVVEEMLEKVRGPNLDPICPGDSTLIRMARKGAANPLAPRRRKSAKELADLDEAAWALWTLDLTYRQIGKIQNCSVATAYHRVRRHLKRQRTTLGVYLGDIRALDLETLRALSAACKVRALRGDPAAGKMLLRIIAQRQKILNAEHQITMAWARDYQKSMGECPELVVLPEPLDDDGMDKLEEEHFEQQRAYALQKAADAAATSQSAPSSWPEPMVQPTSQATPSPHDIQSVASLANRTHTEQNGATPLPAM